MARRSLVLLLLVLAALISFAQGLVGSSLADERPKCSLSTLKGAYVVYGQGTVFIGTPQASSEVDVGSFTADGNGNAVGSIIFSLNGKFIPTTFTVSYLINADCTASAVIKDSIGEILHEQGIVYENGSLFRFIGTDPGALIARVAERANY